MMKKGLMKNRRVTWASDANLCQVRMFLSEESPSQVGLSEQDHLQAKTSWLLHSNGVDSDDNLPPGFESSLPANQLDSLLSQIPVIKWKFPHRLILNVDWQVVAGEESKEMELQNQREMRVLEAIYPRPSAIPSNPATPLETEDANHNNGQALIIPINPIEDEEAIREASHDYAPPTHIHVNSNAAVSEQSASGQAIGVDPDVDVAASAAFTAMFKTNEQGSQIDHDLLMKILSNPSLIGKMMKGYGAASDQQTMHQPVLPPAVNHLSYDPHLTQVSHMESTTSSTSTLAGNFHHHSNGAVPYTMPRAPPPQVGMVPISAPPTMGAPNEFNYYKNLIHQHGSEKQDSRPQFLKHHRNDESGSNQVSSASHPRPTRSMKPCMYFNSPRGCRNGANCAFQHNAAAPAHQQHDGNNMSDVQSAKRMKFDKEITGT